MAAQQVTESAFTEAIPRAHWQLPSGVPVRRPDLCGLAQPCLTLRQHTPRFQFHEASLLLIISGQLDLDDGVNHLSISPSESLLLVQAQTYADLVKTPGGSQQRFRSLFITFSSALLETFHRTNPAIASLAHSSPAMKQIPLDSDLANTLQHVLHGISTENTSDERLQCRLMELLLSLSERGYCFKLTSLTSTSSRVRALISATPEQHWTTHIAGHALAMSEATLRRRLTEEAIRFEEILVDTRMHHALMLLQTTPWSIPHIAQACGYQSRARFSERFRSRFGYLPSTVR
jgi:AraC-like DNA-binding protein